MARDLNVGIIGYDTSHAPAFVRLLNREDDPFHVAGARVVAGYPSFSEDLQFSVSRKEGFRAELSELGVREVCCIEDLLSQVDAVLLESVDGRRHLSEVKPVFAARKPVFIDKPLAASLSDAQEIVRLARDSGTPMFSASSLRYDVNVLALQNALAGGPVYGCDAFSPATLDATNPGLFWYGVHGVETLYAFLGRGCQRVRCVFTPAAEVVVGEWADGRLGTVRGTRSGDHDYGVTVFGDRTHQAQYNRQVPLYAQLMERIVAFFQGAPAPVDPLETLETMAFIEAALESSRQGGAPVTLAVI